VSPRLTTHGCEEPPNPDLGEITPVAWVRDGRDHCGARREWSGYRRQLAVTRVRESTPPLLQRPGVRGQAFEGRFAQGSQRMLAEPPATDALAALLPGFIGVSHHHATPS
jgi:hypothetical protein